MTKTWLSLGLGLAKHYQSHLSLYIIGHREDKDQNTAKTASDAFVNTFHFLLEDKGRSLF